MALIGKIRNNMWFVFALLGVALLAFMLMDSSGPGGGAGGATTAFSVNGEKIDVQELQRIESFESNASGLTGNALRSKVYDDLVTRTIVDEEADKLGINVSEEEMEDLLYGAKLSPVIQQLFRDRRTGTVDRQAIQDVRTNLDNGTANPSFVQLWEEKKKQVAVIEAQNKIGNMVSKGLYTPTWMVEELSKTNNITADIEYVKVPFSAVDANSMEISDADYKAYMEENKSQFDNKEEGRVVEYVTFEIEASAQDTLNLLKTLSDKLADFRTTENDSTYALANGGNYVNFYFKGEDLPEAFRDTIRGMQNGDVVGPIINDRFVSALKLIEARTVADSVELSHIFRPTTPGADADKAEAIAYMDSLKNLIERGTESFDSIAIKYSQDPTSASKGGELGWIAQGQFFPVINEVAFLTGNVGELYRVESPNGIHIIKVTDRIFKDEENKYKVAFINESIEPSTETIDDITNKATEFISDNRNIESLRENVNNYPGAQLKTSKVLTAKDYQFEDYGYADDARDIVLWAFNSETEVGDVSADIFSFRDNQFNYENALVIPALQAKTAKGTAKLSDVKNSITDQVMEYAQARKVAGMMKGKAMESIQSEMTGATSGTVTGARTSSAFLQEIGYEPKVIAAIISLANGAESDPIIGSGGVYKIKVNNKESLSTADPIFGKQSENIKARQNVNFLLFDALKENAQIKDKRMDFGM